MHHHDLQLTTTMSRCHQTIFRSRVRSGLRSELRPDLPPDLWFDLRSTTDLLSDLRSTN